MAAEHAANDSSPPGPHARNKSFFSTKNDRTARMLYRTSEFSCAAEPARSPMLDAGRLSRLDRSKLARRFVNTIPLTPAQQPNLFGTARIHKSTFSLSHRSP